MRNPATLPATKFLFALVLFAPACSAPRGEPLLDDGAAQDPAALEEVRALQPGDYLRPPQGERGEAGVLRFEGLSGETLDLTGITLRGMPAGGDLDRAEGYGIVLVDCEDVTLKGATLSGYRGCVVLRDCRGVTLEGLTFDGWFAERLHSTQAAEDPTDWLRPHENDRGEWLANYGAAISASDCKDLTVRGCRGRHGQNGILLTRVRGAEVYDNDFSFLSGWGLGLFRSSENTISHNAFDYCVRGYSHGVYSRGQDSAGILMFEGCKDNVVAFNSATHGGDGIFVFAGQDLVEGRALERGEGDPGGCDRNVFYGNDLRFSPANGIEVTFSARNLIAGNDLSGCFQHGVWGGYSRETLIHGNTIDDCNGAGITIEHGQENVINQNVLRRNNRGVELYWDPDPGLVDGPLGKQRDTASRDTWVLGNLFENNTQDLVVEKTTGLVVFNNVWDHDQPRAPYLDELRAEGRPTGEDTLRAWLADRTGTLPAGRFSDVSLRAWEGRYPPLLEELGVPQPPVVPGTLAVRAEDRGLATGDRSTIVMGEWGPWDYRSGEPKPEPVLPGGLLQDAAWDATWFRWDEASSDPRRDAGVWRALAADPLVEKHVRGLAGPWVDEDVHATVGNDHFGLIARTRVSLDGGAYRLEVTSDDGVRVLVDGEVAFEDWTWHAPTRGEARLELEAGSHEFTVEYFQIDGATALLVELFSAD